MLGFSTTSRESITACVLPQVQSQPEPGGPNNTFPLWNQACKAAAKELVQNAFKQSGIYPFDPTANDKSYA